jgi:hypothetical protein
LQINRCRYDAVTVEGQLQWQDTLNELNKPFYDACDGIFVNYTWKEASTRIELATVAASSASEATRPKTRADIFFGCDVFGRNTFGGGKWNCSAAYRHLCSADASSDSALATGAAHEDVYSMALFAPGWLMEEFGLCSFPWRGQAEGSSWTQVALKYLEKQTEILALTSLFWHKLLAQSGEGVASAGGKAVCARRVVRGALSLSFDMAAGLHVFVAGLPYLHWNAWMLGQGGGSGARAQQTSAHGLFAVNGFLGERGRQLQHPVPFYDLNMQPRVHWNPDILLRPQPPAAVVGVETASGNADAAAVCSNCIPVTSQAGAASVGVVLSPMLSSCPLAAFSGNASLLVECKATEAVLVPGESTLCWKTEDLLSSNELFVTNPVEDGECVAVVTLAELCDEVACAELGLELQYIRLDSDCNCGETRRLVVPLVGGNATPMYSREVGCGGC